MAIANAGAIFQVANMKFLQPAPTLDYRKNLILHADFGERDRAFR